MKLYDIEFYSAPGGEVLVKNKIKPVYELTTKHRDFITSFLEKVEKKHPLAHQRLCFNCNKFKRNVTFYEFMMSIMFIRCNFGALDTNETDIDHLGNFNFEEVPCPRRGFCPDEGIICKPSPAVQLSSRETTVFQLMSHGLTNNEIAERLVLSPRTVKRHRENLKSKIGCKTSAQVVAYYYQKKYNLNK